MRGLRKILTGFLAATMIMGTAVNASAANIIINRDGSYNAEATGEQTYTYYKIMSADINEQGETAENGITTGGSASYYVDSETKAKALTDTGLFASTKSGDSKWIITLVEKTPATTGAQIAEALKNKLSTFDTGTEVASTGEQTNINIGDNPGYYIITSSIGSTLIAQTLGEDVEINEKNTYPSITKEEKEADNPSASYNHVSANVAVGDTINYKLTINIPSTVVEDIIVTDTMTDGLDLEADTIAVDGLTEGTDWEITSTGERSFVVTLHPTDAVKAIGNAVITFDAVINSDAIVDTGKNNEVTLKYDNYEQDDTVPYITYMGGVHKYDGSTNAALAGVKFTVYQGAIGNKTNPLKVRKTDAGYYVPDSSATSNEVITGSDGNIVIRGLDKDKTYWVYEEETLAGYNLPTTESERQKQLTLYTDSNTFAADSMDPFVNNQGAVLPSTGGMGTTIFYIVGGLLIIVGVAYFIVRRKKDDE